MSATQVIVRDNLDHSEMVRCVQRHRLNGYKWVIAVKNMVTGQYRVEAKMGL